MRVLTSTTCVCVLAVACAVAAGEAFESSRAGSSFVPPTTAEPLDPPARPDQQTLLHDNGPWVTHFGTGYHGANESWVQTNLDLDTYGFGNQVNQGNRLADQFVIPQGESWTIQNVLFFGYQTDSTSSSTITSVNLRIWQGTPGAGGTVVWGDTSTNRLYSGWWTSAYRVLDTDTGMVNNRPVMLLETEVYTTLPAGTYWLDWQADGTLTSGPWVPPVTVMGQVTTGDARQSTDGGASWAPIVDSGTNTAQGLPFEVYGFKQSGNDTCSTAEVLSCPPGGGTFSIFGTTDAATFTEPPPCAGVSPIYPDVWYRIAGTGAEITASTCSNYNLSSDTQLLVYDGSCSGLGCVAANDDDCALHGPFQSTVTWDSLAGTEYFIALTSQDQFDLQYGEFELIITCEASCQTLATPSVTGVDGAPCGSTTTSTSPMLTWSDVAHESGYAWQVRDVFGAVVRSGTTGADVTNANVGALAPGSYTARVRALGDGVSHCDGAWSSDCPFEVQPPCQVLPTPTIASIGGAPCGGATSSTSPVLVWNDVGADSGYRWEVRDPFGVMVTSGVTDPDVTSVTVGALAPGDYITRVQAIGDGVEHCDSPWTQYCSFQIVGECEELKAPEITTVGDTTCGGTTFDSSPVLRWTDVENESGYRWQVRDTSGVPVATGATAENQTAVNPGELPVGKYTARAQAAGDDMFYCNSPWSVNCGFEILSDMGVADFTWWPDRPKLGEKVRFADRATGHPIGWLWETGDGWTSTEQNPAHRFGSTGDWDVTMICQYPGGDDTKVWTVEVAGVIRCGDGACEGSETAWSCPLDCGLPPDASGRAGGEDRRPSVPAAVGGVAGTGGTFWKTEGWVFNPNDQPAPLIFEYTPLGETEIMTVGPFDLEPGGGLYWPNLVEDIFGTTGNGALWIDSQQPLHFLTRSYNESSGGTFGQAVRGLRDRLTIGEGDGEIHLVGLRHDDRFRSNLFFQEVDGFWVTVEVEVFNDNGALLRRSTFDVEGHSNLLKNLGSLGGGGQDSAYVTVEVVEGDGRINVIGSVVDQILGDPTTVDGIHLDQVITKHRDGTKIVDDSHHLVAVVAHTEGAQNSVWGTRFTVGSPQGTAAQQVRLVYVPEYDRTGVVGDRLERTVTLDGGRQLAWEDVLIDLFVLPQSAKTQGALHVFSPDKVLISSRTYNRMPDGSTLGQNIKALAPGDLVDPTVSGTIVGLSHTPGTRTNIGIAAFSDVDTEVQLQFFSNSPALRVLGTITRTVEAEKHLQITRAFEELGLDDTPLLSVHAFVSVRQGGPVYVYASTVDNISGDPTTIEATRNE